MKAIESLSLEEWQALARSKGTDRQYRQWVQKQRSCISGNFSEYVNGEGRNPACHVRRGGFSGIAYKAPYSCVPMTHDEHARQHYKGESALRSKEWFDEQVIIYLRMWIES